MMYDVMKIRRKKYDVMGTVYTIVLPSASVPSWKLALSRLNKNKNKNRKFESDTYGTIY